MKNIILISILGLSFSAFGAKINIDLNTTTATQIRAPVGDSNYSIYYSNIGKNDGVGNWIGNNGNPCDTNLNVRCQRPGNPLIISVSDTVSPTSAGRFYILASVTGEKPVAQPTPAPINAGYTVLATASYPLENTWFSLTIPSFESICAIFSPVNPEIDSQCNQTAKGFAPPVTMPLFLVVDSDGNGLLDPGESVLPINFVVQSTIPQASDVYTQLGLWSFELAPRDREVEILNTKLSPTDSRTARFYFVKGSDIDSAFDMTRFERISWKNQAQVSSGVSHYDIPIDSTGALTKTRITGLTNGSSYYFRTALIDPAGNLGYLTPTGQDSPPNSESNLPLHAAKPEGKLDKHP